MDNKQPIDFSSFSQRVGFGELRAYARGSRNAAIAGVIITVVIISIFGLVAYLVAGPAATSSVGFLVMGGVLGLFALLILITSVREARKGVRMQRFALANGFTYAATQPSTGETGSIFDIGRAHHTDKVISGAYGSHPFWFGTHVYTIGSGKNARTISTGVLAVSLPRAVPRVIVDGRQNTMHAAQEVDRSQRLELEGDFGKYFTVYCPKDYERDVLYFLTPELMQLLIDMDDKFDMELVGNKMYFYSDREILPNEAAIKNLFTVISQLAGEVVENTARYQGWRADKHVASVAPAGLQLKKRIWPSVIAVVFLILYLVLVIVT